jgi:ABC-type branched-subunit amino acid transport system ATPase component
MTEAEGMPRVEQWEAGERTAAPILRVRDLCKRFGGLLAISSLSFDVREGSITAVIGPNGAGKTTIFNLISGLHKPDGGSIFFRDKRIDLMRPHEVPSLGIARTFQNLSLFTNMTVLENVMAGRYTLSSSGLFTCALGTSRYRKEEKRIREKAREWLAFMGIEGSGTSRSPAPSPESPTSSSSTSRLPVSTSPKRRTSSTQSTKFVSSGSRFS